MKSCRLILGILMMGIFVFAGGCGDEKSIQPSGPADPPVDDAPPLSPVNLQMVKGDANGFALTWEPNTESDFAGYNVYVYAPNPMSLTSYVQLNASGPVTANRYVYSGNTEDGVWMRISAVDLAGNESAPSEPFSAQTQAAPPEMAEQDPNPGRDSGGGISHPGGGGIDGPPGREEGSQDPGGTR